MGTRFPIPVQTGPEAHPASCTMGTGSFSGVKSGRGVTLTPHPLLVPWPRKSRAIPLLPLWAVRPAQSLSACTTVHFTFQLYSNNGCTNALQCYITPHCLSVCHSLISHSLLIYSVSFALAALPVTVHCYVTVQQYLVDLIRLKHDAVCWKDTNYSTRAQDSCLPHVCNPFEGL